MHSETAQEQQDSQQSNALPTQRPRRMRRRALMVVARLLLFVLFIASFSLSVLPWGQAITRSTLVLPALISASQPLPLTVTGEPIRHTQMTTPSRSGTVYLDIYAPTIPPPLLSSTGGGVLIVPGSGDNRKVPQLINLSESLARTGLVVMNMTTPTLMQYDLSAQDEDATVQAFNVLAGLPEMKGKRIGIIAFSAGVPLTCFAAADPRISNQVAYIAVFGGYFNTKNLLRAFGRRSINADGQTEAWHPTAVPLEVLTNVITKSLPPDERTRIVGALAPGGTPLAPQDYAHLSPGAKAAYQLLMGNAPDQVEANIAALPPAVHAQLEELSPSRVVSQLHAPVYLLHDRKDSSIPFTESRDFAAALARINHPYQYVEFSIFDHVEIRSGLDIGHILSDGSRLFIILSEILQAGS